MRKLSRSCLTGAIALPLAAFGITAAHAQPSPSLLIVHGIEGSDLGPNFLPSLPIDVSINGVCVTKEPAQFGNVLGPYPLVPGSYPVQISLANTLAPCSGQVVLNHTIIVKQGEQKALVAAEGTNGAPAAEVFELTESMPVPVGRGRVVALHTANAPAVDITLTDAKTNAVSTITDLAPGQRLTGPLLPFTAYQIRVFPTGTNTVVAGPLAFNASDRSVEILFVVGSAANSTVTVIKKEIPGVF
jgi:hypothetical protein